MVGSLKNWRRRCGIPATPSSRNRSTSSSSWLGKILQHERFCSIEQNVELKTEDASKIFFFCYFTPHYFKLHTLLGSLPRSLSHFFSPLFPQTSPTPPPLQVCGYVCAGSRLQQFSSAAQSAHERCGSLQRHHTGTAHLTFSLSHTPHAAGTLTLVKLSRFVLINGRRLEKNCKPF